MNGFRKDWGQVLKIMRKTRSAGIPRGRPWIEEGEEPKAKAIHRLRRFVKDKAKIQGRVFSRFAACPRPKRSAQAEGSPTQTPVHPRLRGGPGGQAARAHALVQS